MKAVAMYPPAHGGYPGEVVVQDEYLECLGCGWSYPLDQGDDECGQCNGPLEVRRAYPVEFTMPMRFDAPSRPLAFEHPTHARSTE